MQTSEAARVAPATAYVVTHTILGLPWSTLASIAAFLYSILMIGEWCWRKWKAWKAKRAKPAA